MTSVDDIKNLLHQASQFEEQAKSFMLASSDASDKANALYAEAAMALKEIGIQEINMGEGYIYRTVTSGSKREFKPDALEYFDPDIIAKYFTGTPKITKKGFEQASKAGDVDPALFLEITEEYPGGEISIKKVIDKEYLKDVRV